MLPRRLSLLMVACAGCTEVEFTATKNTPPEITITNYQDGDTVLGDYPFEIDAIVLDNGGAEGVNVTWYANEVATCTGTPDVTGRTTCTLTAPPDGALPLRVEGQDDSGAVGVASVDLVVTPSQPPVARIVNPVASGTYYDNMAIAFQGLATDAEDDSTDLTASWSDEDGAIDSASPDSTGVVSGSSKTFEQGPHTLTLTVVDGSGKTGTDSVDFTVGGPNHDPVCDITAPPTGTVSGHFNEIVFAATATDPDVGADQLTATWSSNLDGTLGSPVIPTINGDIEFPWSDLSVGTHDVTLTVADEAGATCQDTVTVTVVVPPSAPVVHVEPASPQIANDLLCVVDSPSIDPQGGLVTYRFAWSYDGIPWQGAVLQTTWPGDRVPGGNGAPGQTWECDAYGVSTIGAESSPGVDTVVIQTPTVVQTQVGKDHSCQLDTNSWLECWGDTQYGIQDLDGGSFLEVAGGLNHTCAITPYGSVACVGLDTVGQVSGLPLAGSWHGLDAGDENNCAIDSLEQITCWGDDTDGESDTSGLIGSWAQVSAGWRHTCAVDDLNNIACWGNDTYGRCEPPLGIKFSQVSAGKYHTCGLDTTGLAHCWGRNNAGEGLAPGGTFAWVGAGDSYSCGLRGTGGIECWGQDTGPGEVHDPPVGPFFVQLAVGIDHSCAVDDTGTVTCWGLDSSGETIPPTIWW